jgi:hypothetical protein
VHPVRGLKVCLTQESFYFLIQVYYELVRAKLIPEPPLRGFWEQCGTATQITYYFRRGVQFKSPEGTQYGCECCSFPSLITSNVVSGWVAHYVEGDGNRNQMVAYHNSQKHHVTSIPSGSLTRQYARLSNAISSMSQTWQPHVPNVLHRSGHRSRKSHVIFKKGNDAFSVPEDSPEIMERVY